MKKSKGISNFTSGIIVFASICAVFIYLLYANIPVFVQIKAESKIRDHAFKLEQQGYLTPESRNDLINKLEQIGCKNVSVSGTNSKVGYGMDVYLNVEYDAIIKEFSIEDGFKIEVKEVVHRVTIPKGTVSKCTS